MVKIKLNKYAVINCNGEIALIDNGSVFCEKAANKLNKGLFLNKPYKVVKINTEFNI